MSENQTQDQVNEFGSKISPNADANVALNENGPDQGTLAQILAAIRGKDVETQPAAADKVNLGVDADTDEKPLPTADDENFKFETGNKALDVAVSSFLRSTGASDADIERACKSALEYGDPKLIDRAFIAEKFGDRAADAVALAEAVIEQAGVEKQRTVQAVYDLAGSKEQWDTALGVYKQHAPAGQQ